MSSLAMLKSYLLAYNEWIITKSYSDDKFIEREQQVSLVTEDASCKVLILVCIDTLVDGGKDTT